MKSRCFLLFSLVLYTVACVREIEIPDDGDLKTFNCFSATFEDPFGTKATIGPDGAVEWGNWECIGIFSDVQGPVEYYRDVEDGLFRGDPVSGQVFYAIYPFNESFLGTKYSLYNEEHPTTLVVNPDVGYGMIMVAKSTGNSLNFKQIGGMLHLRFKFDVDEIFVYLRGNHYEHYDGEIDLESNTPILKTTALDSPGTGDYSVSSFYNSKNDQGIWDAYIPMPEMKLSHGFKIIVSGYKDGSLEAEYTKTTFNEVSFSRAQMESYPLIDVDAELENELNAVASDRQALIALYNALDGDNWSNKANWCSDRPLGEWEGVETTPQGRVKSIQLLNNVNGELPEEIGLLTKLESFYVYGGGGLTPWTCTSFISGPIPESIGNLVNLERLSISNHKLSGVIPESMGNLKSLNSIYLPGAFGDYSQGYQSLSTLSGTLDWLAELPLLINVEISNTNISGDFPTNMAARYISDFKIQNNKLTGPLPDLPQFMYNPHWISVQGNFFTGTIPASYASFFDCSTRDLSQFYIGWNHLSGPIPDEILDHPRFSEYAHMLLLNQKDGYKLVPDRVPACRHVFETLDGGALDLGAQYEKADYTMIVRWAEWCTGSTSTIPHLIELSQQYKDLGLQTIWSYGGGNEAARNAYMQQVGLDQLEPHIIECYSTDMSVWNTQTDHFVWFGWEGPSTPFIEIVNRDGNIVFISLCAADDYSDYDFFHEDLGDLDSFLPTIFGIELYESTDFTADGTVHCLQESTVEHGVNIVIMGDAFSDRLIANGTYRSEIQRAADAFFSEEPYKSLRDLFNIYYVDVVSKNEAYYGDTALETWYGDGTTVGGNDGKAITYAERAISDAVEIMDDAVIIVLMNRDYYAGTCYMYGQHAPYENYGRGLSVCYFPTSAIDETFNGLVSHEAGGHGFAKLADEYYYEGWGDITETASIHTYTSMTGDGWYKNIDFNSNPEEVKWSSFIKDNDHYADENIGVFEGACTYPYGVYRPTENSIMRYNTGGFNAPSRYAIWYRINKLAYGPSWNGSYEDFVTFDMACRASASPTQATRSTKTHNFVEKEFEPLAPPVVINKDWREVVGRSRK